MKAITLSKKRDIVYADVPEPVIHAPDWVKIRVSAAGLCGSDMQRISPATGGNYAGNPILGHEFSGTIVETGADVCDIAPGDRVAVVPLVGCGRCGYCAKGMVMHCASLMSLGKELPGGFAEYALAPATNVRKIDQSMDFDIAAMADVVAVAIHAYHASRNPRGSDVLILGDGPVALACLQVYKQRNAVSMVGKNAANLRIASSLGARLLSVEELAPESFDVVVESVGRMQSGTLDSAIRAVRPGGDITVTGVYAPGYELSLLPRALFVKEATLRGVNSYGSHNGVGEFDEALRMLGDSPEEYCRIITHRLPLTEFERGISLVKDRTRSGAIKVVYSP